MRVDLGLAGKVVLVTAASRGLGLAAAQGFHVEGAHVVICGRDPARLDAATAMMPGCLGVVADVGEAAGIDHVIAATQARFGAVDVLVNNAGGPPAGPFVALSDSDWEAAVALTLMSAVRATRAVLPAMQARRWGRIVFISSYGVKQPVPGLTLSNSLRLAVLGFAKTLAGQVAGDNVLVNTVCPGWTRTDRVDALTAAEAQKTGRTAAAVADAIAATIPLGRMGTPAEIAALVVFLGSQAASYITGTAIAADGGLVGGYA